MYFFICILSLKFFEVHWCYHVVVAHINSLFLLLLSGIPRYE
jgi:hypothetical protein